MRLFMRYHWPGNVRELENLIERAVVTAKTEEVLTEDDFPTGDWRSVRWATICRVSEGSR